MSIIPWYEKLTPRAHDVARAGLKDAHDAGYGKIVVVEGYRDPDRQNRLYGHGRSRLACKLHGVPAAYSQPRLPVVTYLTGKTGMHCKGRAWDINISAYTSEHWHKIAACFTRHGATWGGKWRMRDYRHFEI